MSYKTDRGLVTIVIILFLTIILFLPKASFTYNKSWDQGHQCTNPTGAYDGWGRYGYDTTDPNDINDGYTSKKCCELYCKICPVYAHTGRLQKTFTDLMVPGIGPSLTIVRTYLSQEQSTSLLGYGWMFNFGKRLIILRNKANDKIVVVRQETGELNFFKEHSNGTFERLTTYGLTYNLIRNSDGTYSIVNRDGSIQHLNSDGKTIKISDKNGNKLLFDYNSIGCLSRITNASGNYVNFQLGPNGKIADISDNLGRTVHYTYDDNGNLTAFTDPMGNVTQYYYNSNRLLTMIVDPKGNTVESMTYDNHKPPRVSTFTKKGETYTIAYYSDYTIKTDSSGNSWTYYFNKTGIIEKVIDPLGNIKKQHHNMVTSTSVDWEEDLNGNRTTYTYDEYGNITSKTDPLGKTWNYTYIPNSNFILTRTDPIGTITKYEYDSNGNIIKEINDFGGSFENTIIYQYDNYGNLISKINPLGNTTRYEYDSYGNMTKYIDPFGNSTTYTYDNRNNKLTQTDSKGYTTTYAYDLLDRLTSEIDALGNTTTYTYDAISNVLSITDANGNTFSYTYDNYNRLTQESDSLGNSTIYSYDVKGNISGITDSLGNTTTYSYDSSDRLIRETNALGGHTTYLYDAQGNILTVTDSNGNIITYTYDKTNRKLSETNAAGEQIIYTYDGNGNLITHTLPNGNIITRSYDSLNRLVSVSDSIGIIGTYTYDLSGLLLTETDALVNTISYAYDLNGRPIEITDPLGNKKYYAYDSLGNIISITDRVGNSIYYAYDSLGRRITETDPLGNTTTMSYDSLGNILSLTDSKGNTTNYTYDNAGRVTSKIYADGTSESFNYDAIGNLISKTDQNGQVITYHYDSLYRRIREDYPGTNDINYTYDGVGNILTASNQYSTISYNYDSAYRIIQSIQDGKTVSYSFNVPNNEITITYPGGKVLKQRSNLRDLIVMVENELPQAVIQYSYDNANRLLSKTYLNGISADFTYNPNGRITDIIYNIGGVELLRFQHGLDKEGNRQYTYKSHDPSDSEKYVYDNRYRLKQFKKGLLDNNNNIPAPGLDIIYNLDALSNWNSISTNGAIENRIHNEMNEITDINGSSLTYDNNGNLTDDGINIYEYDFQNKLTRVIQKSDNSILAEYKYDPFVRRIEKNSSGNVKTYVYDRDRVIEERNANDEIEKIYIYGSRLDEVLCLEHGSYSYYYLHDYLGSVIALTDSIGNILENYSYDAYGRQSNIPVSDNPYMFTGRRLDRETGLYYFRNRYYSADLGRFLQRDPLGAIDSQNLYEYVRSNPVNLLDPTGTKIVIGECIDELLELQGVTEFTGVQVGGNFEYTAAQTSAHGTSLIHEIYWKMVASGRTFEFETQDQLKRVVGARVRIISSARRARFRLGSGSFPPSWSSASSFTGGAAQAIDEWWSSGASTYRNGCLNGARLVMLNGIRNQLGISRFNSAAGSRNNLRDLDFHFITTQTTSNNFDWVPGDWGYIDNPHPCPSGSFEQGENIIYLGGSFSFSNATGGQFWGLWGTGGQIQSLEDWQDDVRNFSSNTSHSAPIEPDRWIPRHSFFNY